MRRHLFKPALLLVASMLAQACATTMAPSVFGRSVTVVPQAANGPRIKGELLAVDEGHVIVKSPDGIHEIAVPEIQQVQVRRQAALNGKKAWTWTLVGALVSGAGLAIACSSTKSSNCGLAAVAGAAPWIVFGGLAAGPIENAVTLNFDAGQRDRLRPFARFPQGLPPEFDLRGNIKTPAAKR